MKTDERLKRIQLLNLTTIANALNFLTLTYLSKEAPESVEDFQEAVNGLADMLEELGA